jgi:DNA-directed RNA polymerase specialized sigma24 family protein
MKPLKNELADTLQSIRGLNALRQDDLEDYFHDAIAHALSKGRLLDNWLGYLYKSVAGRVAFGREGKVHLQLEESIVPEVSPPNIDLQIDMQRAVQTLSFTQQIYIYAYFYEGFTLGEIALFYGVSNQAVSKTIKLALENMRVVLSDKPNDNKG